MSSTVVRLGGLDSPKIPDLTRLKNLFISVLRGIRLGCGLGSEYSRLNLIHLWSEQEASSETCQSLIEWNAWVVDSVRSIMVWALDVTKVGLEPLFRRRRLVEIR